MRLHDEKPSVADSPTSYAIDLIIWHPRVRDDKPLTDLLKRYDLGERSETVVWLDKFTVRLTMWRHQYLVKLSPDEWSGASQAVMDFLTEINTHYRPRSIEYDTRAFTVGLHKAARRRRMSVGRIAEGRPGGDTPVWWVLSF